MICLLPHYSCIQADDFTAKLFAIYKQVQTEGQTQVKPTNRQKKLLTVLSKWKLYLHTVKNTQISRY